MKQNRDNISRFNRMAIISMLFVLLAVALIIRTFTFQNRYSTKYQNALQSYTTDTLTYHSLRGSIITESGELVAVSYSDPYSGIDVSMIEKLYSKNKDVYKNLQFNIAWDANAIFSQDENYYINKLDSSVKVQSYCNILADSLNAILGPRAKTPWNQYLNYAASIKNGYVEISNNVVIADVVRLINLPVFSRSGYAGGLIINQKIGRLYPYERISRTVIGEYKYDESKSYRGLESYYDSILSGKPGILSRRKINSRTKVYSEFSDVTKAPINGKTIVTTLNMELQDVVYSALKNMLDSVDAEWGTAVVMEVETGKILAMSNLAYNPNSLSYDENMQNFAVTHSYDPGSVMKLPALLCAIEDGKISLTDTVDCRRSTFNPHPTEEKLKVTDQYGPYRKLTLLEVFSYSKNVGTATVVYNAYKDDYNAFYDWYVKLGIINQKTGIDLNLADFNDPFINNRWQYKKYGLVKLSIGYEISLTPLQILSFYNAIANNGYRVKPYLISQIINNDDNTNIKIKADTVGDRMFSPQTINSAHQMCRSVVNIGTSRGISSQQVACSFAGKTGTALDLSKKGRSLNQNGRPSSWHNSTFVGYFPADNPKYSCIVVINENKGERYGGGKIAAPVFAEIANQTYAVDKELSEYVSTEHLIPNIPENIIAGIADMKTLFKKIFNIEIDDNDANGVAVFNSQNSYQPQKINIEDNIMPSFIGMPLKNALEILNGLGWNYSINGQGKIISQSPIAGDTIKNNVIVELELNN